MCYTNKLRIHLGVAITAQKWMEAIPLAKVSDSDRMTRLAAHKNDPLNPPERE
jgi:hypothetical protein